MGIVGANLECLGGGNENAFRCIIGENSAIIYLLDNYIGVWKGGMCDSRTHEKCLLLYFSVKLFDVV